MNTLRKILASMLNLIAPRRADFDIVRSLDFKTIISLPRAEAVPNFPWITSLFAYQDKRVKAIIWELKYRNNSLPLEHVGLLIFEEIQAVLSDIILFDSDAVFLLLPIPISPTRRSERGYNQSEYIARAIIEHDLEHRLLYAPQWFTKVLETGEQNKTQSRTERLLNLRNSFRADENVADKYIILIDDVATTGSTLSEARRTLEESGARDVLAFTIAH